VRLLPIYDEFLIAFRDRQWASSALSDAPVAMSPNTFAHQLVVNGRVEGSWIQVRGSQEVKLQVTPWAPLTEHLRKTVQAEADRYGRFLQTPVRLIITK